MIKNSKNLFILLFLSSIFLFPSVEASWITKKDTSSKEVIKEKKKQKSEWIKIKKKEIKKNKEEFKKEEKQITKEVKSWITKKSKIKYINKIEDLPLDAIYFTGSNETKDLLFYGFVKPDKNSELIDGYYKTSKGIGFFNDGKTTCQIGSTVLIVDLGELTARVSGNCSNGIKFTGKTSQSKNSGWGQAKTSDGKERLSFDFNVKKKEIAKIFDNNKKFDRPNRIPTTPSNDILDLKPSGKYYALLIGNSNYKKWSSLTSPKNDVEAISKILKNDYNFEKVITLINGDKNQMFNAFTELSKITSDKDYVLIYYSGHGELRSNQRYWIPINGGKNYDPANWVNLSDIEGFITSEISAHHLAILSDSCYFSLKRKGSSNYKIKKSEFFEKLLKKRARLVIGSGFNEPVADTSQQKHSMFAMSIINSLKNNENVIKLFDIYNDMQLSHASLQQTPYGEPMLAWGHGGGDFLFIKK